LTFCACNRDNDLLNHYTSKTEPELSSLFLLAVELLWFINKRLVITELLTRNVMKELNLADIEVVVGGVDSGEASLGIGMVALAIGIVASGPVGWVGAGAAAATSFGGGLFFGNAIANDGDWEWLSV
tara:strand:- start:531 stop:911 length:381 start_codon:yes stop_codon:yes gene_type:complete